jgi:glycerate-2-kinase
MKKHLIRNYRTLATSELRATVLDIFEAGMTAVSTETAIRKQVAVNAGKLRVGKKMYDLANFEKIFVIGCGKASVETARVLEKMLGKKITGGVVIDVRNAKLQHIKSVAGTHPFPSVRNLKATAEIVALLKRVGPKDLVITIVSGGGSALLFWPHSIRLENYVCVTKNLMRAGATIREMNTVRKHLSALQGGQLVKLAHSATMIGLIFSDVPGDDIGMIASGPTVLDTTTVKDAKRILTKYNVTETCKIVGGDLIETPNDAGVFKKVQNVLVVNNVVAVRAMVEVARKVGFKPRVLSTLLAGEASEVGEMLVKNVKRGEALIAAGETTVHVIGRGHGGRNQEVAMGALEKIPVNTVLLAISSDGHDNSVAAGALSDLEVVAKAKKFRLDVKKYLADNNSFEFTKKTGSQVYTGITNINISDLFVVLRK